MRTFIALELSEDVKKMLQTYSEKLHASKVSMRWVEPQNMHLTLNFLGEIDPPATERISTALAQLRRHCTGFSATISGFGFFPPHGRPRVLFAAVTPTPHLITLVDNLNRELQPLGFSANGRFKAHITLGRFVSGKNLDQLKKLLAETELDLPLPVDNLTLYQSTLSQSGPTYRVICQVWLNDK